MTTKILEPIVGKMTQTFSTYLNFFDRKSGKYAKLNTDFCKHVKSHFFAWIAHCFQTKKIRLYNYNFLRSKTSVKIEHFFKTYIIPLGAI